MSLPKHLCYTIQNTVRIQCASRTLFNNKPQSIRPLLLCFDDICHEMLDALSETVKRYNTLLLWYSLPTVCDFTLTFHKEQTPHERILQEYLAHKEKYANYTEFYPDAAKTAVCQKCSSTRDMDKSGKAAKFYIDFYCWMLCCVSSCRENAKQKYKEEHNHSDSLGLLTVLHSRNAVEPLVGGTVHNIEKATTQGHVIRFYWILNLIVIEGYERADVCAALSCGGETKRVNQHYRDCMKLIYTIWKKKWQKEWDSVLKQTALCKAYLRRMEVI